ncbi:hypothetical protein [Nostoc sp. JL33]|uniref:hypothetical protein n=1 Tax=Nostoc sp. JL33 TaxID=2815396 RepID=UPI0025FB2216|nr:hypothetical protein [Nostoc sp. JL33]MBN3872683.1 hypothetical protein [Nostoc sp. JL33]
MKNCEQINKHRRSPCRHCFIRLNHFFRVRNFKFYLQQERSHNGTALIAIAFDNNRSGWKDD